MRKMLKKATASVLSLSMLTALVQLPVKAETVDVHLPEVEIEEAILQSDVFYLASTTAKLQEGANERYLLRVARGGDAEEEAGVNIKISDMTAKYGKDYTISVLGTDEKVENTDESVSLMEMMDGEDYTQSELKSDEEFYGIMEGDEELQKQTEEAMQGAVDYIEEKSGLKDTAEQEYSAEDVSDDYAEVMQLWSGEEAYPQKLTSSTDAMQQIQQMANVITDTVIGSDLTVNFEAGEKEKYLVIDVKDNKISDGDRNFFLMLGAPYGSTTNSAASSCAVTIADDEKRVYSKFSFSEESYTADGENLQITVTREDAINTLAVVRVTNEALSALAGRDFSPVDKELAFPFGISKMTVDIPIRHDYLTEDADFLLKLEAKQNAEIAGGEAHVTITPKAADTSLMSAEGADGEGNVELMAERSYTVEDIVLGETIDHLKPSSHGKWFGCEGFKGICGVWIDHYALMHKGKDDWGALYAQYKTRYGWAASYAGYRAALFKEGDCAEIRICTGGVGVDAVYDSDAPINGVVDIFNNQYDASKYSYLYRGPYDYATSRHPAFINKAGCKNCDRLEILGLQSIYRPYEVYLEPAKPLEFLNEDGTKSAWADATTAKLSGANNQANNYLVRFAKDGLNNVSIIQNDSTYVKMKNATLIRYDDNYKERDIDLVGSDTSVTHSFNMDEGWIMGNIQGIELKENQVPSYRNQDGSYGGKGVIHLRPNFDYRDAKVVVKVPTSTNFGYFKINNESKDVNEDTTYTYHRGDTLKLDTVMRDEYKNMYEPVGYKISIKQNESDTNWVKRDVYVPYDDISDNRYLNEGRKLKYSYYEITPIFQRTGNAIAVRVKADDLQKFDPNFGFMKATAVNDVTVGGVAYKEYVLYGKVKNGKVYTVGAKLAESAGNKAYINWKETGSDKVYVGDMFYHRASGNTEDNVITVSVETGASSNMYETLEGTVIRPAYNMRSHDVSVFNNTPAADGIVSVGSEYAVIDSKGYFRTPPIRAMYGTADSPRYMRYMLTVNGTDDLRDVEIKRGKTETQDIFMTEGSGETTTVKVVRQSVGYQLISVENGSILNNISVYRDSAHQNEGTNIVVDFLQGDIVKLNARLDSPPQYTKQTLNSETGEVTESIAQENITDVSFVEYDPKSFTKKAVFKAEKMEDGSFSAKMKSEQLTPGYEIYIRVTTDRSHGVSSKTVRYDDEGQIITNYEDKTQYEGSTDGTTYADVFTGYTIASRSTVDIPVEQRLELPMQMNFTSLPFIGTTGINCNFPFVTIGAKKTDTGYRMYLGFNPTSLYDAINKTHTQTYMDDNGKYMSDMFSIKHPIDTFKEGLKESLNAATGGVDGKGFRGLPRNADASLGAPTWKMSVVFGVYFDFTAVSILDPSIGKSSEREIFQFEGVGGFLAISAGFRMAWYVLLPVVFIPAYFGIQIDGTVMGFFGATTDKSKPAITYDDAKEASVDFNGSLSKFRANVKLTATIQIYAGVGLAGTIGIRGGGTVTPMVDWDSAPKYVENEWGCALSFTAGIWIDLLLFTVPLQYNFPMLKYLSFVEYDELMKNGVKLQSVDDDGTAEEGAAFGVREAFTDKKSEWLPDDGKIELMSAFKQTSQQTIVENGYEHPDTQLIKLSDGSIFMAFLDNDSARGEVDRTVLKYAVYKDGVWSDNYTVQNDATGDFQPSIAEIDGGKVMISWVSTPESKRAETDKSETKDYLNKLEVYTAVIDPSAKTVSELTQLTDDTRYDYKPTCVYDDKTKDRVVYYSKNFDDNATTEEMANPYGSSSLITYMLYSKTDGKWLTDKYYDEEVASDEDRQTLINNWHGQRFIQPRTEELGTSVVPNIADFTAISYNGLSVYAYTVDVDSNADTVEDRELFVQIYDFERHITTKPVRLTNDNPQIADAMPQFARHGSGEDATTKLFWYRNSKQIAYIDISELVREGVNDDGTIKDEYLMSQDEDETARYKKELSDLYSYVSPIAENQVDATGMADFKPVVDGNDIYIVWTQPMTLEDGVYADDGKTKKYKQCREVYATAFIQDNTEDVGAAWATPYRLTYNEVIANSPTAVVDNSGNLMVAYNTYEQTMNNEENETFSTSHKDLITFSNPKLMASYQVPCGAVDVTDITLSDTTPRKDENVEITLNVKNTGLTYANGYTIDVYEYKNGTKGTKIGTITSENKLLPDNNDTHTIEWTAPENVDGMSIYTEAREANFDNFSTFESEKLEKHPVYEFLDAYTYQDNNGAFRFHATVKNTGNADSADDDAVNVTFVGPYGIDYSYSAEEHNLGSISLKNIPMYTETVTGTGEEEEVTFTGQTEIDGELNVPKEAFEEFGYIDAFAEPVDKEGNVLGDGEDVRMLASKPVDIKLNGAELPEEIKLNLGETFDLNLTGTPTAMNEVLQSSFASDDSEVALVDGNTLIANAAGETTLHSIVNPYNMELQDIKVTVSESDSQGITVTYDSETGVARVESSEAVERADLIFAEYDGEGRLVSAKVKTVNVVAKGGANANYKVQSEENTLKIMLWDSLGGMKPLDFKYVKQQKEVNDNEQG